MSLENKQDIAEINELNILEKKLSLLMLNSEESFVLVDTSFKIVAFNRQFNKQYIKYFGTQVQQGNSILDLVQPDRVANIKKLYKKVFAGATQESELEIPLPEKQNLVILNRYKPAFDENGNIIGAFVTSKDISALKRTESERNSALDQIAFDNSNYRAIIDNSNDLIWSCDKNLNLITFNAAFETYIFKQTKEKVKSGENILLYFKNKDIRETLSNYSKHALKGKAFQIEIELYSNKIWHEVKFNPIRVDKSIISGIACMASDITERNHNNSIIEIQQERLDKTQRIALIGNWHYNIETKRCELSDQCLKILGLKNSEFKYKIENWTSKIHPEDQEQVNLVLENALKKSKNFQLSFRILLKNGRHKHIFSENEFITDESDKPKEIIGFMQDVTERVHKEIELKKLLSLTQTQNEWLNHFNLIVSHNLSSNNNNIKELFQLFENEKEDQEKQKVWSMLKLSTNKLYETISNLREFVHFQNDSEKSYKKLSIRKEIEKTLGALNSNLQSSSAKVKINIDESLKIKVIPAFLESILMNIITNAIKYRSPNRELRINFKHEKNEHFTCISVQDNGIGIDLNKHHSALFGLFKTFHRNKDAVGFGLFMTKKQMEMMNGKIEVESTLDKGSLFKLYFYEKN
jgi:PAS domain S-box-containing protein